MYPFLSYVPTMWYRLYHVFTYIYSLLIRKDICDHQNVSVKLPCVYVGLSSEDLFIFLVKVSSSFPYCCVIRTSIISFPCNHSNLFLFMSTRSLYNSCISWLFLILQLPFFINGPHIPLFPHIQIHVLLFIYSNFRKKISQYILLLAS